jgi:hypothetical protein
MCPASTRPPHPPFVRCLPLSQNFMPGLRSNLMPMLGAAAMLAALHLVVGQVTHATDHVGDLEVGLVPPPSLIVLPFRIQRANGRPMCPSPLLRWWSSVSVPSNTTTKKRYHRCGRVLTSSVATHPFSSSPVLLGKQADFPSLSPPPPADHLQTHPTPAPTIHACINLAWVSCKVFGFVAAVCGGRALSLSHTHTQARQVVSMCVCTCKCIGDMQLL